MTHPYPNSVTAAALWVTMAPKFNTSMPKQVLLIAINTYIPTYIPTSLHTSKSTISSISSTSALPALVWRACEIKLPTCQHNTRVRVRNVVNVPGWSRLHRPAADPISEMAARLKLMAPVQNRLPPTTNGSTERTGSTQDGRRANGELGLPRQGESARMPRVDPIINQRSRAPHGVRGKVFAFATNFDGLVLAKAYCASTCGSCYPCGEPELPPPIRNPQRPRPRRRPMTLRRRPSLLWPW